MRKNDSLLSFSFAPHALLIRTQPQVHHYAPTTHASKRNTLLTLDADRRKQTQAMPAAELHDTTAVAAPPPSPMPSTLDQAPPSISQLSLFTRLPSELILDIFSYLDIVTIFRFLDTCRYHRYLLLNLPEIWNRVRFIPLSEYSTTANTAIASLSAAAATSSGGTSLTGFGARAGTGTEAVAGPSRYRRPIRTKKPSWQRDDSESSGSESESGSDGSDDTKSKAHASTTAATSLAGSTSTATDTGAVGAHRLKHAENERDRERGGSRTLISEIYAVLRRFRKENRLVDFVREVCLPL